MSERNIALLKGTLEIMNRGYYYSDENKVTLELTKEQMQQAHVILPDEIQKIENSKISRTIYDQGRCSIECLNMDSLSASRRQYREYIQTFTHSDKPVLVLNFASPIKPGGGVWTGAKSQEQDLCHKSSLLLSLESESAKEFYNYHQNLRTYLASDAMIISPQVEVIRDENDQLLEYMTDTVAVLTCSAPMVTDDLYGMSNEQYQDILFQRIANIFKCAAYFGYDHLVLGAWGCGAFGNDPELIAELFYKAMKEFTYDGWKISDLFRKIDFAVLDKTPSKQLYRIFQRYFSSENYYKDEDKIEQQAAMEEQYEKGEKCDRVRGCLFGGAVGDALGYPIEFMSEEEIHSKYGEKGIQVYQLDSISKKALISDDTQMTLFTASGVLACNTRNTMSSIGGYYPSEYIADAYQDWLQTQEMTYKEGRNTTRHSWLMDIPEMYHRRAPGNTCLSALTKRKGVQMFVGNYRLHPINQSKGCGGVMRVAPIGLKHYRYVKIEEIDYEGANAAAITHGHSLGYMPAAVLTHIISRIVYPQKPLSLKEIVLEARDTVAEIFADDQNIHTLTQIITSAVEFSENSEKDLDNIHQLGEGWVAEETLGIAIYCALRYQNDFSAGVIAAVNHNGDSDSTGAVTGNILGAWLGFAAIDEKWKENLELSDVILEMADDLCQSCSSPNYVFDLDRMGKYMLIQQGTTELDKI